MKRRSLYVLFFYLVVVLLVSPTVLAIDTPIKIKTLVKHEVQATVYDVDSSSFKALKFFKAESDQYGDVEFVFSSNVKSFNLVIYVKKNGEKIMPPERFLDLSAGEPLDIRIAPAYFNFIETPLNESELTNSSNETSSSNESSFGSEDPSEASGEKLIDDSSDKGITGAAIVGEGGIMSKTLLYSVIIIVVLVVLSVIIYLFANRRKNPVEPKVRKLSELKDERKEQIEDYREVIEDAERKIREAQEEIRKMKNQSKIKEMEKKLREDQAHLERLREGKEE